jgi:hypothetical protein
VRCSDPAGTAVDLATDLLRIVHGLLVRWRQEGHELGVGIGLALGYATLGILGVDERIEYVPVGSVVNLSSRLCDQSSDGEILVSQSLYSAVSERVRAERTDPLLLPGFPSPVTAWRLLDADQLIPSETGESARHAASEPPAPLFVAGPAEGNVFQREGEGWTLAYRGCTVRIRDSKGLGYLAQLMSVPGQEVHVADLIGLAGPEAMALRSDAGPVIDEQARQAYRARLAELEVDRDEAREWGDLERAARAEEEIQILTQELAAAYGVGGRARRMNDPSERMRKAVTNRIRQTMAKIESLHPDLGRHLSNAVRTGTYCSYAPETPVEWRL